MNTLHRYYVNYIGYRFANVFVSSWLGSCSSHLPAYSTAVGLPRRRLPSSIAHWPSSSLCWHQYQCRSPNKHSVRGQTFLNFWSKNMKQFAVGTQIAQLQVLLCLNNNLNPTRLMRFETAALRDSCCYGRHKFSKSFFMHECIFDRDCSRVLPRISSNRFGGRALVLYNPMESCGGGSGVQLIKFCRRSVIAGVVAVAVSAILTVWIKRDRNIFRGKLRSSRRALAQNRVENGFRRRQQRPSQKQMPARLSRGVRGRIQDFRTEAWGGRGERESNRGRRRYRNGVRPDKKLMHIWKIHATESRITWAAIQTFVSK